LLNVENLTVVFDTPAGAVAAVDDVTFHIHQGECLGLVGESGSGKSMTAFSIVRLVPPPGRIASGRIWFRGRNLVTAPHDELRQVRGAGIGFVFQEPMAALNPVMRVCAQIAEALIAHRLARAVDARDRAIELLRAVRIPQPESRVDDYPHQLSGGMQQRVMLAIALACRPPLVIADEPTTALDVTVQAQILDLLRALKRELDLACLLITHDLGVIAETADRVAVMQRGKIVETGPVRSILRDPSHEYTRRLLASVPADLPDVRIAPFGRLSERENASESRGPRR
jgi:ABC-type dipeptide/oligopeptide/nickel transport system ATPase component